MQNSLGVVDFILFFFICHIIITKNVGKEGKKRSGEET